MDEGDSSTFPTYLMAILVVSGVVAIAIVSAAVVIVLRKRRRNATLGESSSTMKVTQALFRIYFRVYHADANEIPFLRQHLQCSSVGRTSLPMLVFILSYLLNKHVIGKAFETRN